MSSERKQPKVTPFSWLSQEAERSAVPHQSVHLCTARDVAAGVAELLVILERDEFDRNWGNDEGADAAPLLSANTRGNLQRFAISSLKMLTDSMDAAIEHANKLASGELDR